MFDEIETVEKYARLQAEITHCNSEGIRGACAIAAATKMALDGWDKNEIKDYISNKYYYDLSMTLEEIKVKGDHFRAICQETVPQALMKMFNLINIGERAGSGVPNIFNVWNDEGFVEPEIEERFDPDRIVLTLSFVKKAIEKSDGKKATKKATEKARRAV